MKAAADAARRLRDSNPVASDAFAGAAGDSLGRATFERIVLSPGPAQVAGRSPRWRRPFWLAAVAAGVAVAAVAAFVVPGALLGGTQGPDDAAAAVVKRVDSALSVADPGAFAHMTVTTSVAPLDGGKTTTSTAQEWSYGDQWRSVTYSPAGHPVYDEGFTTSSGYVLVSYPAQTWARQRGLGLPARGLPGPGGCGRVFAAVPVLFQPTLPVTGLLPRPLLTVARVLRAAVSCGTLAVAGRQRINGIETIELTSRRGPLHETIWVSPGSYLPVRVVVRSTPGRSLVLDRETVLQQTANISWRRPTAQNLAKLAVPTPAGFHRVTLGRALRSIVPQMPGGLLLPLGAAAFGGAPGPGRPRPLVPSYQKPPKSS